MARIPSNNLFGSASGRIGNLVFYTSNGIQIVRALPKPREKAKLSALQKLHINSFKAQYAFARSIKQNIIDRIWGQVTMPAGLNPYNYFIKFNKEAFGKFDHIEFPQLMTLSTGKLLPVENLKVGFANNKLSLNWICKENYVYASYQDRLIIAILTDKRNIQIFENGFIRSDEKAELELNELNTDMVEGFIFWVSPNNNFFSRSDYWRCIN